MLTVKLTKSSSSDPQDTGLEPVANPPCWGSETAVSLNLTIPRGECQPRCQTPCQTISPAGGVAPVRLYLCGKAPRPRQRAGQRRPARTADRRRAMQPAVVWNRDGLSPLTG